MKYVFKINIYTDGNFGFSFIPRGMNWNDDESYDFKMVYHNRDEAIQDAITICEFLTKYMYTYSPDVKTNWNICVNKFIVQLKENDKNYIYSDMRGNYPNTEFILYEEPEHFKCEFFITDEEHEMFLRNHNKVTLDMIREAVFNLYRGAENENN